MKNRSDTFFVRKVLWTLFFLLFGGYTLVSWDYHFSQYLFEKHCSDSSKVGLFVYETVELGEEYLMLIQKRKDELRNINPRFILNNRLVINSEKFNKSFLLDMYVNERISAVGPVTYVRSTVFRKLDNKLLGEAVSVQSGRGWLMQKLTSAFGGGGTSCPINSRDRDFSNFRKNHENLIKHIFTLTSQGE